MKKMFIILLICILALDGCICNLNLQNDVTKLDIIPVFKTDLVMMDNNVIYKPKYVELNTISKSLQEFMLVDVPLDRDIKYFIYNECGKDIELYFLILAVIKCESDFNNNTISCDGYDIGYMQIRSVTHKKLLKQLGLNDIKDPYQNLTCGIYMIKQYITKYNNYRVALMAYNFGESGARKLWKQDIYTSKYAEKVLAYKKELEEKANGNRHK